MAKITWLGEDTKDTHGPNFNIWNGVKFPKGKAVEVENQWMIDVAKSNQFYKVTGNEPPKKAQEQQHEKEKQETAKADQEEKQKAKEYDFREAEKGSGYSPKKRVRKSKRVAAGHAHRE